MDATGVRQDFAPAGAGKGPRRRSWRRRLAVLLVGLAVGALVGELVLRWVEAQSRPLPRVRVTGGGIGDFMQFDDELGRSLRPGADVELEVLGVRSRVAINQLGLRGREIGAKPSGTRRILVVGDSFTFGWGVAEEDTFVRLLEQRLRSGGAAVEVINAGIPGLGTVDEVRLLERVGTTIEPDLVVLAFCVGNDLPDNRLRTVGPPTPPHRSWLTRRSALARRGQQGIDRIAYALRRSKPSLPPEIEGGSYAQYLEPLPAVAREAYAITRVGLRDFVAASERLGAPTLVVLLPDQRQFPPYSSFDWLEKIFDIEAGAFAANVLAPNRELEAIAAELELPLFDLHDTFVDRGRAAYLDKDPHWNATGHELAAAALADFLSAGAWLDPSP